LEQPTTAKEGIPPGLAQLRAKLGQKAKQEPKFRFYTLYSHLLRWDVLETAWTIVRRNAGAAGYDGVTFEQIGKSERGVYGFLEELQASLKDGTYRADPVRRVYIPKSDGKMRPLGIPTIKDRVVQAALLLIIEPIFEEDFLESSFGFRPEKSAHQAIDAMTKAAYAGQLEVYDADLEGYFDSIPHDKLIKAVESRIVDQRIIKLIRMWLEAPIWEEGKPMKRNERGTPQGGVISPLLSNLYLHWFDKIFHSSKGPGTWAKATIVRYADDFVVMARYLTPRIQEWIQRELEGRFGLKINRKKTRIVDLKSPETSVDFLGFNMRWIKESRYYIQPKDKSLKRAREQIRELTSPKNGWKPIPQVIGRLNRFLIGWGNYFNKGCPSRAYQKINWYVGGRMIHFLRRRSQRGFGRLEGKSWYRTLKGMGLFMLSKTALKGIGWHPSR
jgi:RNA-directed DNA polymerase